ncbi:MAG TPA: hypothetical protein VNZ22_12830 [Bacillota bacterium]|nr:hypothetical protein [Bacillota bacterium]
MKRQTKLTAREQAQQQALEHQHTQQQSGQEFANVEELLRHDALHTPVPPSIAQRLQESLGALPAPPPRSWWRRWLGS